MGFEKCLLCVIIKILYIGFLRFFYNWLIMFSLKSCHTEDESHGKYPFQTCDVTDDIFGDMFPLSWPNLVYNCGNGIAMPMN